MPAGAERCTPFIFALRPAPAVFDDAYFLLIRSADDYEL